MISDRLSLSQHEKGDEMSATVDSKDLLEQSATFGAMTEGTALDWKIIAAHNQVLASSVSSRVLDHLRLLEGDHGGFSVDRMEHSLQTATRAAAAARLFEKNSTFSPTSHRRPASASPTP